MVDLNEKSNFSVTWTMQSLHSPVLACRDVLHLMNIRSCLPSRSFVSVKANITSISDILRMKHDDFFLIELDHLVYILVKDFHLEWHQKLGPLTTVVFHDLRLTTIEKGVSKPQTILIAWKTSQISVEPQSNRISHGNFKEWLDTISLSIPNTNSLDSEMCNEKSFINKLHNYKGTVTDICQSVDAIYVLDNTTRLFTGFIPPGLSDSREFEVGSVLQVFNVHRLQLSKGITLVACSHSLIRCEEPHSVEEGKQSLLNQSKAQRNGKTSLSRTIKCYIHKYGLNYEEAETVLRLKQHLGEGRSINVPKIIDNVIKSDVCGNMQRIDYSPIDLFMQHEILCPMSDDQLSGIRIPCVQSVHQLKSCASLGQHSRSTMDIQMPDYTLSYWTFYHQEWKDKEVLLGTINVNRFGQLEFVDKTGKIPIVLFQDGFNEDVDSSFKDSFSLSQTDGSTPNRIKIRNHCCSFKCLSSTKPLEKCICPFISHSIIGKTLITNKYHLVREHFNIPSSTNTKSNISDESADYSSLTYLLISLLDCIVLENATEKSDLYFESGVRSSFCGQPGKLSEFIHHSEEFSSCLIHVSAKESIVANSLKGNHFSVTGTLIKYNALDSDTFYSESCCVNSFQSDNNLSNNCDQSRKRSFYMENSDCFQGIGSKKLIKEESGLRVIDDGKEEIPTNIGNDHFTTSQEVCKNRTSETNPKTIGFTKNNKDMVFNTQSVTLFISGLAANSYPFFTVNKYYLLKTQVKGDSFKPIFSNEKFGQTLFRSNSAVFIDIRESLIVEKAVINQSLSDAHSTALKSELFRLLTVTGVLQQSEGASTVSFRGVIQGRESLTPKFTSKGSCSADDIKLLVRDLGESNVHIRVYFKSFKAVNMLGLIPGSVIDFHSVERKVSQQGNVYCKFGIASSFYIHQYIGVCKSEFAKNSSRLIKIDVDNLAKEYLFNIWHLVPKDSLDSRLMWRINCQICMIFKLSLKVVCSLCQGLYFNNECQSRGCNNSDSYCVKVHAVVLVDDGTCQASVKFFSAKLVQKLLTLTDEQWADLISVVLQSGEILVSKFESSPSHCLPIEKFVYQLVQSPLVIRACFMAVCRLKDSPNSSTVAKMNIEDFKVRDTHVGKTTVPVLQSPLLQLECVDLKETPK